MTIHIVYSLNSDRWDDMDYVIIHYSGTNLEEARRVQREDGNLTNGPNSHQRNRKLESRKLQN